MPEAIKLPNGQKLVNVHSLSMCEEPCPIHAPSRRAEEMGELLWRDDRRMFERVCRHGVGHPDPDWLGFVERTEGAERARTESVHGCDGCCSRPKEPEQPGSDQQE